MARNKLEDLRNHLFVSLERLNDEELTSEQIEDEVRKSKAIVNISNAIVETAKLEVNFLKTTGKLTTNTELFKSVGESNRLIDKS